MTARSIKDVVRDSRSSPATIYREIRLGKLRAKKLGRKTIVLSEDFDAWLKGLADVKHAA